MMQDTRVMGVFASEVLAVQDPDFVRQAQEYAKLYVSRLKADTIKDPKEAAKRYFHKLCDAEYRKKTDDAADITSRIKNKKKTNLHALTKKYLTIKPRAGKPTVKTMVFPAPGFFVKHMYTDVINACVKDESESLTVFDRNGP